MFKTIRFQVMPLEPGALVTAVALSYKSPYKTLNTLEILGRIV